VALDIDPRNGGDGSIDELELHYGPLPETVESRTGGGGRHLLFRNPGVPLRKGLGAGFPGVDLKADGGYIVAPPSIHPTGAAYAWHLDPGETELANLPEWLLDLARQPELVSPSGPPAVRPRKLLPCARRFLASGVDEGARNVAFFTFAKHLRNAERPRDEAEAECLALNAGVLADGVTAFCRPSLDAPAVIAAVRSAYEGGGGDGYTGLGCDEAWADRYCDAEGRSACRVAKAAASREAVERAITSDGFDSHCTDAGNAARFAVDHGDTARYCWPWHKWLVWDGIRWKPDQTGEVMRLAREAVRGIYAEAAAASNDKLREALGKWALKSEDYRQLRNMVDLAASASDLVILPAQLDADFWLLNCANGTLDLRTGELREPRREDYLTKMTPVVYDPQADCSEWLSFLRRVTDKNDELMAFLQRLAGYALTGSCAEEKLFFVHGPTATGKSTFLEALRRALGDYGATTSYDTFLKRRFAGSPRSDLAVLEGVRLAVGVEVEKGARIAEGLVKWITGNEQVTARKLYQNESSFQPQFKIILAANDPPEVRDDDDAIWRRVLEVPFVVQIPERERDPNVKRRLRDPEIGGRQVLAWAVQGCLTWQRDGLGVPDIVRDATAKYRQSQNPLLDFIDQSCDLTPDAHTTTTALLHAYQSWAKQQGIRFPLKAKQIAERLPALGCTQYRENGNGARGWRGIEVIGQDRAIQTGLAIAKALELPGG